MNKKKKLSKKKIVLFIILGLIFIGITISFINKQIMKANDKKIKEKLNNLIEEKIDYVFVEINPKFALKTQNTKIIDIGCLNNDCVSIYDNLDIIGKSIEDGIDYIYNFVKDTGKFNVDKVLVKTNNNVKFDNKKEYIAIENISINETKEILKEIINNNEIKDDKPIEDYNTKLLNELKTDKDYGKIYECDLIDNEVKCYIKNDLLIGFTVDSADFSKYFTQYDNVIPNLNGIGRVLNKFGLETIGETELGIFYNPAYAVKYNNVKYRSGVNGENYLSQNVYYDAIINCSSYSFDLTKINLLDLKNLNNYLYADGNTKFEEYSETGSGSCGKKLCTWAMEVRKNTCDQTSQTTIYGDEVINMYYKVCDTNNENCKVVPVEEFGNYSLDHGYIFDLKVCTWNEGPNEACRQLNGTKWEIVLNNPTN